MKKIILSCVLVMVAYHNATAAKVTYGTAYEAMDGVSHGGCRDRGQFKAIDDRVKKWSDEDGLFAQCLYLDKLGGQRQITPEVNDAVQKWMQSVFPRLPKYYKTKIVQATDQKGRMVQDHFLKRCGQIREIFEYISAQSILLGQDQEGLSDFGGAAAKLMYSTDWKLLADKQSKTGVKGVMGLTTIIREKLLPEIEKSLKWVLARKQEMRQRFLQNNSNANHDELLLRAQIAERKKKELEAKKRQEELEEWALDVHNQNKREANRNGENGIDAQREQAYLDNLDQQSFLRMQRKKKAVYTIGVGASWQQSAPAAGR